MHRNINHQFNNGHVQRRPELLQYMRNSLIHQIKKTRLTTALGCLGFVLGILLIVRNEARGVFVSKFLDESLSLVTVISSDSEVDTSNIGKLVCLTGVMTIHEPLTEVDYGISVLAVRLLRNVQMYQWVEYDSDILDSEGNIVTTNYYYHTEWQNNLIDSSSFANSIGHWNPKEFPIKRDMQVNENVRIGNYYLGLELKKEFTDFVPITSDERPERPDIKLHSGLYYHSQDLWHPEVGDVRIQFSYAGENGQILTVFAKLDESLTLVPYFSQGVKISMVKFGQFSLEEMFAFQHSYNKFYTWVNRGGGWVFIYCSCLCLSTHLHIIVSHSGFLQNILLTSHSSLSFTVSICVTLLSTSLSWVWYRPILGFGLLFVMMLFLIFNKLWGRQSQAEYNRLQ